MAFYGSKRSSSNRGLGKPMSGSRGGFPGSSRGGRGKPIFDSVRIAQQKQKDGEREDSESENRSIYEDSVSEDLSTDEEEDLPTAHSYAALMQSFAAQSSSRAKRRKLTHNPAPKQDVIDEEIKPTHDTDNVEEAEEGPEIATDGLLEESEDELGDTSDPFEAHFADPDDDEVSNSLKALQEHRFRTQKIMIPAIGRAIISIPSENCQKVTLPPTSLGPNDLKLKQKLSTNFSKEREDFDPLEGQLASVIFNHYDLLFCERTPTNAEKLRRLICLHFLNHIFKTRDRVIKNNARLARDGHDDSLELRDQGFTRPKVLFIIPTRESCHRIVNIIISLCEPEQQENRMRFEESYVEKTEKFAEDKATDFRELFDGNNDDMFRLGIKFTRKTVKYFSQFYNSDVIFASPLGLRMALEGKDDKKGDYDFLSSIELVIVDQADALLMQNWEHVEYIFEHLNLQPREAHGCDFSRVRSWYLDNHAKYFRQTITLSAFNTPELNTLFYNQSLNWRGRYKISAAYPGVIQELGLKIKQTFSRLESPSFATDPDARFAYFTTAIIPALARRIKDSARTVIFIPSYLDFVKIRNYFATSPTTNSLSFGNISEYTSARDVARARSHFLSGRHNVLLYTERAHHFKRYQIRGVKKVIMYGLPDNPIFYKEIVGGYLGRSVQEGNLAHGEGTVKVIFSKWDVLKLERIAGTDRVGKMISEKGDTFDFL